MSEADTVDDCLALLKENGYSEKKFQFSKEVVNDKPFKERFARASKTDDGSNRGRPDIFAVNNTLPIPLVIIVECKRRRKDHGSSEEGAIRKTAVGGVRHYMQCFWEDGKCGEDVVGIAFSGDHEQYCVTFFAICSAQNKKRELFIKPLGDENQFISFNCLISEIYSFTNAPVKNFFSCDGTLYCSLSINFLAQFTIHKPSFNRLASEEHIEDIVDYLGKQQVVVCKGVLIIAVFKNKYYIIDGQHRLAAYKQLYERGYEFDVVLQVITVESEENMRQIYEEHYQLRGASAIDREAADKDEKASYKLANEILNEIQKRFGKKKNNRGRRLIGESGVVKPYIDRSKALELLIVYFDTDGVKWLSEPLEKIMSRIEKRNQQLKDNPVKKTGEIYADKILDPCHELDCWLGLIKANEWLS